MRLLSVAWDLYRMGIHLTADFPAKWLYFTQKREPRLAFGVLSMLYYAIKEVMK